MSNLFQKGNKSDAEILFIPHPLALETQALGKHKAEVQSYGKSVAQTQQIIKQFAKTLAGCFLYDRAFMSLKTARTRGKH